MKVIITQGCSASGKSVWAEQFVKDNPDYVNINRDDIRASLFCDGVLDWTKYKFTKENEKRVTQVQHQMIFDAAMDNRSIIISDTNLNPAYVNKYEEMECLKGYDFEYKVFHADLITLLDRDAKRSVSVGYSVITKQYEQYLQMFGGCEEYGDGLENAIIVDIDGTLAKMHNRTPYEWHKVGEDLPRMEVIAMVKGLIHFNYCKPIFVSGRDAVCMQQTQEWLENQFPELDGHFTLLMREQGDMRKDTIVKAEICNKYINLRYNVVAVLDDRPSVCRMWKEVFGYNVIHVGNPYLEF